MSFSSRPASHGDRDLIVRSLLSWLGNPSADATAIAYESAYFSQVRLAWCDTRQRYFAARGAARAASAVADDARNAFGAAFRRWYQSCTDAEGRPRFTELSGLLGGVSVPGITRLSPSQEVSLAGRLLSLLDQHPDLQGDVALLKTLQVRYQELQVAVQNDENATRLKIGHGKELAQATRAFDTAYGRLVRAFTSMLGNDATWRVLPRFVRRDAVVHLEAVHVGSSPEAKPA